MNIYEYKKVKNMDYQTYCSYLQNKYGIPKKAYFTTGFSKNHTITRTNEGLVIHHKKEDVAIMLANLEYAKKNPYEFQLAENLVYCDYLEHLFLHILICEDVILNSKKTRNERETQGAGGVVNFIGPELNDLYSGFITSQKWRSICYEKVINDKDVYLTLIERFISNYWKPLGFSYRDLTKSYNEKFGIWNSDLNIEINKEIISLYSKY